MPETTGKGGLLYVGQKDRSLGCVKEGVRETDRACSPGEGCAPVGRSRQEEPPAGSEARWERWSPARLSLLPPDF